MRTHGSISREFKVEAVRMITEQVLSATEVARDLDIHRNMLRKRKQQLTAEDLQLSPGSGLRLFSWNLFAKKRLCK